MTELTLESLAKRIEILERKFARLRELAINPGTGDWDSAAKAAAQIRESLGFDFDAIQKQNECDLKHSNDHLL
jgi:hypothetical protein